MASSPPEPPLAFQAFYQRYHRVYLRYALLHLGDSKAAIEAVETVFVQLLESWGTVLSEPSVPRYAISILRQAIAAQLVMTEPAGSALVATTTFAKVRESVRNQLKVLESSLGLYAAIARLPERQLDVVLLRFVLGYEVPQVAEIMGVSCGTV
ncbi:sigma-70 family RNA polymerase sigma factor, partial [Streptomyces sp. NPDC049577]|uniref:RNA polymerase sigma factor n=1 Tax=Streptomyces sp. NPDC049577 TaxID=3155153 RepID=UPI00342A1266